MRKIKRIFLHCSDTPDERAVSVDEIRAWHLAREFSDIGYHFVIHQDGSLEKGRSLNKDGASVRGHNAGSIAICLIGRNDFREAAFDTAIRLTARFCVKFDLPVSAIFGHYELDPSKTCPNFEMRLFRGAVSAIINPEFHEVLNGTTN